MQTIRQASERKSALRFWNRALGIKARRNTPRTQQSLTGVTLWGCVAAVLALILGGGASAWAQDKTTHYPVCQTSALFVEEMEDVEPEDDQRYIIPIAKASEGDSADLSDGFSVMPVAHDSTSDPMVVGNMVLQKEEQLTPDMDDAADAKEIFAQRGLLKLTVPVNTAGMLMVSTSQTAVNGGALCRGGARIGKGIGYTITTAQDGTRTYAAPDSHAMSARVQAGDEVYVVLSNALHTEKTPGDVASEPTTSTPLAAIALASVTVSFTGVMPNDDTAAENTIGGEVKGAKKEFTHAFQIVGSAITGLLTVETTGDTDTAGTLIAGTGDTALTLVEADPEGNFMMQVPVQSGAYSVTVKGRAEDDDDPATGTYGLVVNFFQATASIGTDIATTEVTLPTNPDAEDATLEELAGMADKYYWFTLATGTAPLARDLTIKSMTNAMTAGELFGPLGASRAEHVPSGNADFKIQTLAYLEGIGETQALADVHTRLYILKVRNRGSAEQKFSLSVHAMSFADTIVLESTSSPTVTVPSGGLVAKMDQVYLFNVKKAGVLSVESMVDHAGTNPPDLKGALEKEGMDSVTHDDISRTDSDFQLVQTVSTGFYTLRVSGFDQMDAGEYDLTAVFIAALTQVPVESLDTEKLAMACTDADFVSTSDDQAITALVDGDILGMVDTSILGPACVAKGYRLRSGNGGSGGNQGSGGGNQGSGGGNQGSGGGGGGGSTTRPDPAPLGYIEDPSGVRSGIGMIRGWICEEPDQVRVHVFDSTGRRVLNLRAAYGTTREDTRSRCGRSNTGFGLTYNFNLLEDGMYTVQVLADGDQIGRGGRPQTSRFEVVHLSDSEWLTGLDDECVVPDFPEAGLETTLEWAESLQNFVIGGVMEMEEEEAQQ